MKKLFLFILCLLPALAIAQQHSLVYGNTDYMVKNPAFAEDAGNSDLFILKHDAPDGAYTIFYDHTMKNVFQKGFLKNGVRSKIWSYYFENQNPKMEIEYSDAGVIEGLVKEYYESGKLKTETQFKNGKANGLMISYNENGTKKLQVGMKDGNMYGKAMFYDENGNLKQTTTIEYKD